MGYFNFHNIFIATFYMLGIFLAKGFWFKFLAIVFPPYGYYLVVEKAMLLSGFLN